MVHLLMILLSVAVAMIVLHEAGHAVVAVLLGADFEGVRMRGLTAAVKLRVDRLTAGQVALTLMAGPVAEAVIVLAASVIWPPYHLLFLLILGLQWAANVTPWPWFPTDGRRLWLLYRDGRSSLEH